MDARALIDNIAGDLAKPWVFAELAMEPGSWEDTGESALDCDTVGQMSKLRVPLWEMYVPMGLRCSHTARSGGWCSGLYQPDHETKSLSSSHHRLNSFSLFVRSQANRFPLSVFIIPSMFSSFSVKCSILPCMPLPGAFAAP